jgi:hypothetical protein
LREISVPGAIGAADRKAKMLGDLEHPGFSKKLGRLSIKAVSRACQEAGILRNAFLGDLHHAEGHMLLQKPMHQR